MKFELALLALVASASASNNFKRADSTTTSDDSSSSEVEDCNSEPCQIYRAIENDCKKDAGDDFAQLYTCLCESGDYWAGLAECNCGGGVPDIDEYKANYCKLAWSRPIAAVYPLGRCPSYRLAIFQRHCQSHFFPQ